MPDCSWPGTWQTTVYVPGASPSRVRLPTPPASTIGLASLVSSTARLWAIEPMFMICNVPPAAIVIVDGSIVNADRWTMAVDGADDSTLPTRVVPGERLKTTMLAMSAASDSATVETSQASRRDGEEEGSVMRSIVGASVDIRAEASVAPDRAEGP